MPSRAAAWAVLALLPGSAHAQGMGGGAKALPRPSAKARAGGPAPRIELRDVASEVGLTAPNVYGGESRKRFILEMSGNGAGLVDFDNDGRLDVLFVNGARLEKAAGSGNRLYRNTGEGRFDDVTAGSGLEGGGWGQGVCAGDYDNDGNTDLLVTRYGANVLYRNLGGGKFQDVTVAAGLPAAGQRWSTSCAFLDYDRDGLLDIFVSNYVRFDLQKAQEAGSNPFCFWKGVSVFCGPRGFPTGHNILYRNEGGGRFRDVSKKAGVVLPGLHYGLGVVSSDFDDDGWPDVYVACDSTPGILYINNRKGGFTDIAVEAGTAYGDAGQELGSMGVTAGDYDGDGRIDILKTNFMDETPTLYRNFGDRYFEDATYGAGLGIHTGFVGWGVQFMDVDQDGWKDILMAHGHIYPELEQARSAERYPQPKLLYWNIGNGAFRDVTAQSGSGLTQPHVSRGAAAGDLDGDGSLEAVVVNMNAPPSVLKNFAPVGKAILLRLEGVKSNRSAIGARVTVQAGGRKQTDEVRSGGSYASQPDFRLHFGLGSAVEAERVTVRWPSGATETLEHLPSGHVFHIREGSGIVARHALRTD